MVAVCIVGLLVECNGVVVLVVLVDLVIYHWEERYNIGDLCACCGEENQQEREGSD